MLPPLRVGAAVSMVAVLVSTVACTGGGGDTSTSSGTPTTQSSPTIRKNEYQPVDSPEHCRAVSAKTLRKLGMRTPDISTDYGCRWSEDESDDDTFVERELTIGRTTFTPPLTRRSYTASEEAHARFGRLSGWEGIETTPVKRLGDEAKVARWLDPSDRSEEVWLAVRERNVVLEVKATNTSHAVSGNGAVVPYGRFESGALAAAREMLAELTGERQQPPPVTGYQKGERKSGAAVCPVVAPAAKRLVPGVPRVDTSARGAPSLRGCAWESDDAKGPDLSVDVVAVPPSRLTGETATQAARVLYYTGDGEKLADKGLGDEAKLDWFSFDGGESRTAELLARKGNVLVSVEYDRWQHPSKRQLRRDTIRVARDVLKEYS